MKPLAGKAALVIGHEGRLGPVWFDALVKAGAERVDGLGLPNWDICTSVVPTMPPDVMVINAGVDDRPGSPEAWPKYDTARAMCDVNLLGAYRMLVEVGGKMKPGSSIVLVASLYGLVAPDARYYDHRDDAWMKSAMYGATKAGIISMVRYFAGLYGPRGVRVNALAPGGVVDPADPLTQGDPVFIAKYTARIPMGRMCRPADLAGPLVFLASDASSFVTGHVVPIDGGFLVW